MSDFLLRAELWRPGVMPGLCPRQPRNCSHCGDPLPLIRPGNQQMHSHCRTEATKIKARRGGGA